MEKSCRMTSSVNSTPPIGELKIALMPAAEPQPMSMGICGRGDAEELPEARCDRRADLHDRPLRAGAIRRVPIVMALVRIFSTADAGG